MSRALSFKQKILPFSKLLVVRKTWENKKVVTTNGCFDLLHMGHIYLLEKAKSLGDVLIVGVNRDQSVRKLNKGQGRPIQSERERAALVASLACVDYVFLFSQEQPTSYLVRLRPDVHVKGGDYRREDLVERKALERLGTEVVVGPFVQGVSTTRLIHKIQQLK